MKWPLSKNVKSVAFFDQGIVSGGNFIGSHAFQAGPSPYCLWTNSRAAKVNVIALQKISSTGTSCTKLLTMFAANAPGLGEKRNVPTCARK